MSSAFQVHIFEGIEETDLATYFSQTIGSKYCPMTKALEIPEDVDADEWEDSAEFAAQFLAAINEPTPSKEDEKEVTAKILKTPGIWIGEASPLKAGLLNDTTDFVPDTICEIDCLVGEDLPVITDDFIATISRAFDLGNTTEYKMAEKESIIAFFEQHKGKRVFSLHL